MITQVDMQVGSIYKNKANLAFEIVEYNGARDVLVRFIDTGYETITQSATIRSGLLKDRLFKSVSGVGFIGVGEYSSKVNGKRARSYTAWVHIINICYNSTYQQKNQTYIGHTVVDEWHNYQNFAKWYEDNYPRDGGEYQLAKGIKDKDNKIYGPDTCLFVSGKDNTIATHANEYEIKSPTGDIYKVYNMSKFCEKHNLNKGCMSQLTLGRCSHHKGWTKA